MKKPYTAPELEILILEQSDIITASGTVPGGPGTGGGDNSGILDGDWE